MSIYVVDTGERDLYIEAATDYEAAEAVAATGERVNYAEFYSDGWEDVPEEYRPHKGHFSHLGGTWFCDTCNSPYCELA